MSKELTADQVDALKAWVLVLQRAHARDRRMIAIAALGDLGSGLWIRCECDAVMHRTPRMHLHEAFSHLRDVPGRHALYVDQTAVTVRS